MAAGTPARRQAQRKLAKQVREGTYQKSNVGKKAREAANKLVMEMRDAAFFNMKGRLETYVKYDERTVEANVYGGTTRESGQVPGMDLAQARWTARADTEELRSRATPQYRGNPWFYH